MYLGSDDIDGTYQAFKEIITSVNYTDIKSFENILKELEFTSQAFVFLTSGFIYL